MKTIKLYGEELTIRLPQEWEVYRGSLSQGLLDMHMNYIFNADKSYIMVKRAPIESDNIDQIFEQIYGTVRFYEPCFEYIGAWKKKQNTLDIRKLEYYTMVDGNKQCHILLTFFASAKQYLLSVLCDVEEKKCQSILNAVVHSLEVLDE
ncbi:MAG: hypothetical protein RR681_07895 [Lachnospiraceae bacterium]